MVGWKKLNRFLSHSAIKQYQKGEGKLKVSKQLKYFPLPVYREMIMFKHSEFYKLKCLIQEEMPSHGILINQSIQY